MDNQDIEQAATEIATEESPLLSDENPRKPSDARQSAVQNNVSSEDATNRSSKSTAAVLWLLLIGVFISNADGSIVLATYNSISSEFLDFQNAAWLTTGYTLAMCSIQPLIGKLSDIFGRKPVLLICYVIFGIGQVACGLGQTMWQVILGRAVGGLGGAGMSVIVSILITDLVPKIEIASWRSYVNVVATLGRSLGGPLGGWITDSIGWRWSFLGQAPLIAIAILLVAWGLRTPDHEAKRQELAPDETPRSRLSRVDFPGAILICSSVITLLLALELPVHGYPWSSPLLISLIIASLVLTVAYAWFESTYAKEPIFPPRLLLERNVLASYFVAGTQTAAQLALMFSVPLYFQIVEGASNTRAGAHLIPAVLGNAVGGLLTGYYITKSGHYKGITIFATLSAISCYTILIFRWRGPISTLESFEIIPGGFASGIVASSTFIALTAKISKKNIAIATSGIYLASTIGMVLGVSLSSSIQNTALRLLLTKSLPSKHGRKIVEHVLSDISYINRIQDKDIHAVVMNCFIISIKYTNGFSLICSGVALVFSLIIKDHNLLEKAPAS